MTGAAVVGFGTLLVIAAWWMLARAMPPSRRGSPDVGPRRRRQLRITASALLPASFACFVGAIGIEQGPVFWTCVLMLGAMGVALRQGMGDAGGGKRPTRTR